MSYYDYEGDSDYDFDDYYDEDFDFMAPELKKHKRSDAVKWGISFFLIIVLLLGIIAIALEVFTDKGPSTWKQDDMQTEEPDGRETSDADEINFDLIGNNSDAGELLGNHQ